ncbi:MAG: hypothetical protein C4304_08870 [candidate division GAL15 bacterium]
MGPHTARLEGLRGRMAQVGCDLVVLGPGDDFRYLCGWSPLADERLCVLLVACEAAVVVAPRLNLHALQENLSEPILAYGDGESPQPVLNRALGFLRGPWQQVAVSDDLRADHFLLLQQLLPDTRYLLASWLLAPLRARKDPGEVLALRQAARLADLGVRAAFQACRPGASELEVAEAARAAMAASGAEEVPFVLVASGPNSALPHHEPGTRQLRRGEPVLVDWHGTLSRSDQAVPRGQPGRRSAKMYAVPRP